jgi:hypothetical protein
MFPAIKFGPMFGQAPRITAEHGVNRFLFVGLRAFAAVAVSAL